MSLNIVFFICGIAFALAGCIWLWTAWSWYTSFPVPYVWLVWVLTSPIWFLGALVFLSIPVGAKMRAKRLAEKGVRIRTKFFNVEINFLLEVNSRHPYVIQTVGASPKTGEKLIFKSGDIWFNPEPFARAQESIDVLIDPDDPNCYMMDISFLEKAVKEQIQKS